MVRAVGAGNCHFMRASAYSRIRPPAGRAALSGRSRPGWCGAIGPAPACWCGRFSRPARAPRRCRRPRHPGRRGRLLAASVQDPRRLRGHHLLRAAPAARRRQRRALGTQYLLPGRCAVLGADRVHRRAPMGAENSVTAADPASLICRFTHELSTESGCASTTDSGTFSIRTTAIRLSGGAPRLRSRAGCTLCLTGCPRMRARRIAAPLGGWRGRSGAGQMRVP